MSSPRRARAKRNTGVPQPPRPKPKPGVPESVVVPAEGARPEEAKPAPLEKLGLYFSIVGGVALVASLISHVLLLSAILGISYILILIAVGVRDKSIGWPAWRVIIALVLAGACVFLYYVPPRTENFMINLTGYQSWSLGKYTIPKYPITADPQTGNEYQNSELDFGQIYNNVNARCFTNGHIAGYPGDVVTWVSIKGGAYDGLWIPYEAFFANSPGAARDIPACDSFWFKIFPFL